MPDAIVGLLVLYVVCLGAGTVYARRDDAQVEPLAIAVFCAGAVVAVSGLWWPAALWPSVALVGLGMGGIGGRR